MLEAHVLGSFQIKRNGMAVDLPSRPAQALLAYLLLNRERPVRREKLAGLLWPDADEANARSNLRHALWRIRKALEVAGGPVYLDADDLGVSLRLQPGDWLDVAVLESPLPEPAQVDDLLRQAQACGGELLPGFYEDWVVLERTRLQAVCEDRLGRLAVALLRLERWSEAAAWCEQWIALGGAPEPAYRYLMLASAGQGNQAGITAAYQRCRQALRQELGVEPGEQTAALQRELAGGGSPLEALARLAPPPQVEPAGRQKPGRPADSKAAAAGPAPAADEPQSLLERIACGQFVARQVELAEALRLWSLAEGGAGQVLLVSGEPGVGKTRFARELIAQVLQNGATVLVGECFAEGRAPYAPLAQAIAAAGLEGAPPAMAADLLMVAPALRSAYPDIPPNPFLEPQAERQRIFDHVTGFFALLAEQSPLLLFIDDVHWADSGSLFLLHQLARRGRSLRLLIVLTYREVELSAAQPLYELLQELNRERLATRLALKRFDREQTEAQLAALFQDEITPEFRDGIYNQTDGNPFFVEEVCKALIEAGKVYREGDRWQRLEMNAIEIPQSVRVALELRVGRLPQATQDTLRAAAVLGREFEFDVLLAMDGLGEEALIDALEAAERAQLIAESRRNGTTAFRFSHALIALTLHDGLSALRRQRLHRRAAQAIERVHAGELASGGYAAALGWHYAEAGDPGKAAGAYLQAAERARNVYAYQEALAHYRQALASLKALGAAGLPRAARTAMTLGQLYHTVFDFERSQQAFQEAFALWERVEEAQRQVVLPPAPHPLRILSSARYKPNLDLTTTVFTCDYFWISPLFCGLAHLTPEWDITPDLARSWEILDGGRRYIFRLRPEARWSDGRPVTAGDFEFTWKRQLNPAIYPWSPNFLFDIQNARACHEGRASAGEVGVRALDDHTLEVQLEAPAGYFLNVLASLVTGAIPRHAVEARGETWADPENIVTDGPFLLESRELDQFEGQYVFRQNPAYHRPRNGNLERVEMNRSERWAAGSERLQAYEADACDICVVGRDELEQALRRHPDEYAPMPNDATLFAWFRLPPFDDRRVRQAFAHAIDRVRLAREVFGSSDLPATGGFIPACFPGHSPGIGLAYDPERARRLLAEAGYSGGHALPMIQIHSRFTSVWLSAALPEFLQQQWQDTLGVRMTLLPVAARPELALDSPAAIVWTGWIADYPDIHTFLGEVLGNWTPLWHNDAYEHLISAARRSIVPVDRVKIYQAADRILTQEAAILPLIYRQSDRLIKPWVRQYSRSSFARNWKDVIIDEH